MLAVVGGIVATLLLILAILAVIAGIWRLFNRDVFGSICAFVVAVILFILI